MSDPQVLNNISDVAQRAIELDATLLWEPNKGMPWQMMLVQFPKGRVLVCINRSENGDLWQWKRRPSAMPWEYQSKEIAMAEVKRFYVFRLLAEDLNAAINCI